MPIRIINIIPQAVSAETFFDSEPSIAVNPANTQQIVITSFSPVAVSPGPVNTGLYFWSNDGGFNWAQAPVIPGGDAALPFKDASVRFGGTSGVLYAGILRQDNGNLAILRKADFTNAATLMTILSSRPTYDQPWVEATTNTNTNRDIVYVSGNDLSQTSTTGRTASVDFSLDAANAATPPAPSGFQTTRLEVRGTGLANQDGPQVRTAIHSSGVVYGAFCGWRTPGTSNTTDIVVVRDDNWASGPNPFQALIDPVDSQAGIRVVSNVNIPPSGSTLGTQRTGWDLAIAVDPNNSQRVYLAWCDGAGTSTSNYTLHVRRSVDRGQTWTQKDLLTVANAINPALAVNSNGKVALLYQEFVNVSGVNRWKTHLALSTNHFESIGEDIILANVLDSNTGITHLVSIGDYLSMVTVGLDFYGVFSAFNVPDYTNFPSGVTYLRSANFTTNKLLGPTGVTVSPSVDPFFFRYWPPDIGFYSDTMSFFQNFSNKNFELVVREEDHLQHYYNDFGVNDPPTWNTGAAFGSNINPSSSPVMFQNFSNKNLELVVREGNSLKHYWNDFGGGSTAWNTGAAFGSNVASTPVMFQNSDNKNFELVVAAADGRLQHYYNDYGTGSGTWNTGAAFGSNVVSDPVMFQNSDNHNFELVVREGDGLLRHYYNDYAGGSTAWNTGAAFGSNVVSDPVMFYNFSNNNFELVVREANGLLRHYYNDYGTGNGTWNRGAPLYD
jgi:hypothetical protein